MPEGLFDASGSVSTSPAAARILGSPIAAFWMIDPQNRTSMVNQRTCDLLGYSPDEMMGRSLFDFMDDRGRAIAARNVERRRAGINEDHPFCFRHRNGHPVWVRLMTGPVNDTGGEYLGAAAWIEEIGETAHEVEALRAREALLRAAVDNSPNGIVIVDAPHGHIRMANAAALTILPAGMGDPTGRVISELQELGQPSDAQGRPFALMQGPLGKALRNGVITTDEEIILRHPDGGERSLILSAAPVFGADGAVRAGVLVFTDITERRRLEEERVELERRVIEASRMESLGRLAGGVAHDFNNLLATLMGRAELALFQLPPGHPARTQVEKILEAVQRSSDLTRKMLAYAGRTPLDIGPVLLDDVLQAHLGLVQASLQGNVTLEVKLSGGLPPTRGDAAQLRHLVTELVESAARRAERRSSVTVRTGMTTFHTPPADLHPQTPLAPGSYLHVAVSDDASSLSAEAFDRLMAPLPPPGTGTTGGYDLTLILGIVKGHSGGLRFRPYPQGGTQVEVFLPTTEAASAPLPERTSGLRLLVVDDESEVRDTLCEVLEALGHHPQGASSGRDALSLCAVQAFDLCLLDLTMPDMDGAEVAMRLQRVDPGLPVVVCSGWAPDDVLPRFGDRPPHAILQKPVMPKQLVAVMERVLRKLP